MHLLWDHSFSLNVSISGGRLWSFRYSCFQSPMDSRVQTQGLHEILQRCILLKEETFCPSSRMPRPRPCARFARLAADTFTESLQSFDLIALIPDPLLHSALPLCIRGSRIGQMQSDHNFLLNKGCVHSFIPDFCFTQVISLRKVSLYPSIPGKYSVCARADNLKPSLPSKNQDKSSGQKK